MPLTYSQSFTSSLALEAIGHITNKFYITIDFELQIRGQHGNLLEGNEKYKMF